MYLSTEIILVVLILVPLAPICSDLYRGGTGRGTVFGTKVHTYFFNISGRIPLYFRNSYNKLSKYILVLLLKWDPPEYSAAAPGPGVTTHMLVVSAKLSRGISRICTEFGFSFRPRLKLGASRERASSLWSMVVEPHFSARQHSRPTTHNIPFISIVLFIIFLFQ